MDISCFMKEPNCTVPEDIGKTLENGGNITPTHFKDKNDVLSDVRVRYQAGFTELSNGNYLVSMYCPMPEVTEEMVNWWFWWHPQKSERYKAWYPGEHFAVSYSKKDKEYFESKNQPEFRRNMQYPVEKIGKLILPLSIDFVSPEEFGFSREKMEKNGVAAIVCGHVGAFGGTVEHTEMAHIFFKDEKGLFMVSRFWLGERLKNPLVRKFMLNRNTAKGMAEHCCVEYRNFARRIPTIFTDEKE